MGYAPKGSSVTFVLPASVKAEARAFKLPSGSNAKFSLQFAEDDNPASTKALIAAGIKDCDAVMVVGMAHLPPADGDALVISTLLQVRAPLFP